MEMDDVYKHAKKQLFLPAPPELVTRFRERMKFIREHNPHSTKTIDCCMAGVSETPTLLDIILSAYVVNGGVAFKHPQEETPQDEWELNELMLEIQELAKEKTSDESAPTAAKPEISPPRE
jgi:hypothetical protein